METRNLRKERTGVVTSNKMDKSITVAIKWKENTPFMESSLVRRRNIMLTTKITNATLAIP
mgnify:CR=1 FL=1